MKSRLPFDVYFVVRCSEKWKALLEERVDADDLASADDVHGIIVTNEDCWIVTTFLHLRRHVGNVYLVTHPVRNAICVVSGLDFGIRDLASGSFFIGARSDGPNPLLCHLRVVQNRFQTVSKHDHCIPHWPQPALKPRLASRGTVIENVVFYGSESNLEGRFQSDTFRSALARMGTRLIINGRSGRDVVDWSDYRHADLVLAARNLTQSDAFTKPASKLVNAWAAGVPALLGPEPAFQDLRRSGLDYFEVRSADDALRTIATLKAEPSLYLNAAKNGLARAAAFSVDGISQRWLDLLSGAAADEFRRWSRTGTVRRTARKLIRIPAHRWAQASAERARTQGPRVLDDGIQGPRGAML